MADGLRCWSCGTALDEVPLPISRHANCPGCYTELHCCRLCQDFDPVLSEQCRDDRADPPHNKEGANFCEFFRPTAAIVTRGTAKGDAARSELDSLFGAGDSPDSPDSAEEPTERPDASDAGGEANAEDVARAKLDALFKNSVDSEDSEDSDE